MFSFEVDIKFKMGHLNPGLVWTQDSGYGTRLQGAGDPGPGTQAWDPGLGPRPPGPEGGEGYQPSMPKSQNQDCWAFSYTYIFDYMNGHHNQYIQVDIIFYMPRFGLQETVFIIKVQEAHRSGAGPASTRKACFNFFYKDMFLEVPKGTCS